MDRAKWKLLAGAFGVVLAATLGALWIGARQQPLPPSLPPPVRATAASPKAIPSSDSGQAELGEALRAARAALEGTQGSQSKRQQLDALRQALSSSRTNEVSAAIRSFLDSKADAATGQGFKIGGHGALSEAPTLRVTLLDYLGQIDPAAGAAYARTILASP